VLSGGTTADPCSPGTPQPSNAIFWLDIAGTLQGTFTLPAFVSDLAIDPDDPDDGTLILADAGRGQLARLDLTRANPTTSATPVSPTPLLGNLTCPSAVRLANGVAFAVTADRSADRPDGFVLRRYTLATGQTIEMPFVGPQYLIPIASTPSSDGNIQTVNVPVRPVSICAYDLAITPDGSLAEFATRARYLEQGATFTLSGASCTAVFDIVEYGLYALDLRSGNASYQMHAQVFQQPASGDACVTCVSSGGAVQQVACTPNQPQLGDRPAGITAVFGP
jgi:hypothetical protein